MKKINETGSGSEESWKSTPREYLESLVVTVILALFGTTFLIQAFKIPSSSMEDTLLIGDHLMVDKVGYAPSSGWDWVLPYDTVNRDEIIIFRYPLDPGTYFVKRVIGVPGDRVRLQDKKVFRNGELAAQDFAVHKDNRYDEFRDSFPNFVSGRGFPEWMDALDRFSEGGEIVVPEGKYFVMGDNRDYSSDSRYWGFVPRENIIGKPLVLYWSYESTSEEYRQVGLAQTIARIFDVAIHFPQKTRWQRMLRVVH
jgi:signal peptidase I